MTTAIRAFTLKSSSGDEKDNSDDVEEILRKARLSIDSSYDVLSGDDKNNGDTPDSAASGSKNVTFKGVPDLPDASFESHGSDVGELVVKTQRLLENLKQTEIELSGERALRKKKDKNIMKLAKQLKRRNADYEESMEKVAELAQLSKDLEQKLMLTQKELRQQEILHEKYVQEHKHVYEKMVAQHQAKYAKTCSEHDNRITELSKSHAQQCEELCREILKANLEADRLQNRVNTLEGTDQQRAMPLSKNRSLNRRTKRRAQTVFLLAAIIVGMFASLTVSFDRSYLCAPARPGRVIREGVSMSFEAPWWAPNSVKDLAYQNVCAGDGGSPIRLDWILDSTGFKIVLSKDGKTTLSKRATSIEVMNDGVRLWNKKGYGEEVFASWS